MKKNIIKSLLAIACLLCSIGVYAHDFKVDDIYYRLLSEENQVAVTYYGDDEYQKSVDQTDAILAEHPDVKVICAPTTVGIMAAAKRVDTTGAGDSFWGGFLHKLLESNKTVEEITLEEAAEFARFGNAVASLCVEKRGAIPAMPTLEDVAGRI